VSPKEDREGGLTGGSKCAILSHVHVQVCCAEGSSRVFARGYGVSAIFRSGPHQTARVRSEPLQTIGEFMPKQENEENKQVRKSAMSLFMGEGKAAEYSDEEREINDFKADILNTIAATGTLSKGIIKPIINGNMSHVLNLSSGSARLHAHAAKRFSLIMSQPQALSTFNRSEIRCCLCHSVISWPAWYYVVRYAVSHFHYFVCFDSASPSKPSCKCYRRE